MSETSAILTDSPEYEQPAEGVHTNLSKLLPSLLIPARPEAKEPAQHIPTYTAQLPQLHQHRWRPGTGLSDLILAPSDPIITFYHNPSHLVPRATILDHVLDKELAAWVLLTLPNVALPSLSNMFPADQLLTLLTNFTRHNGTTADRDHAKDVLHAVCIRMLEKFETPTTYRSKKVHPSYYCGISFTLLHYENRLFQFPSQTYEGAGQQVGRLSSWDFHQDHVMAGIQSLGGEPISRRFSWQQACGLASMLTGYGPLFKKVVTAYGQPPLIYTAVGTEMTGSSTGFVSLVI
jgi:hypothetical protein